MLESLPSERFEQNRSCAEFAIRMRDFRFGSICRLSGKIIWIVEYKGILQIAKYKYD